MIKHIVLFKLKDVRDTKLCIEALCSMRGRIEGLVDINAGADFLHSDRSYDVALTCTFTDRAAFDAYQNHPVHVPVKELIGKLRTASVAADYEV